MKVLLCQDVEKLGWFGDIVEVKDGYARNYLLPYGICTVPSEANIKSLSGEKSRRAKERKLVHEQLERAAVAVEGAEAVIAAKANEQGHLFGSVGEHYIATNLREQGYEIADGMVALSEHIKEVGTHEVPLRLASDLMANIIVTVVPEGGILEDPETGSSEDASQETESASEAPSTAVEPEGE